MKHILTSLLVLISLATPVAAFSTPAYAADPLQAACNRLSADERAQSSACVAARGDDTQNPLTGPNGIINRIANGVALIAGAAAVIIIIVSAIGMTTSGGDMQRVQTARNGVIYAVVGLVIIVLARGLIALVLNKL
jgi:hypothetical protein